MPRPTIQFDNIADISLTKNIYAKNQYEVHKCLQTIIIMYYYTYF